MGSGDIYLGRPGQEVLISPFGRVFTQSTELIAKEERTNKGRLVRDIVADKEHFVLAYDAIDNWTLQQLMSLENLGEELSLIVCNGDNGQHYTVSMQPISRQLLRVSGLWSDCQVEMEEV